MPFCHLTLKAPKSRGYAAGPLETLGDHLRARRTELGIEQKEAARAIGVSVDTIGNWERGDSVPEVRWYPAIMAFLGYCPYERADTLGKRLELHRTHRGLTQKEMARLLGVDAGTLSRWETGVRQLRGKHRTLVELTLLGH